MMQTTQPLMSLRSSLPVKLAVAALVFVGAVEAVRLLTLDRLSRVDTVSSEVHDRWLDSVRTLGNLSEYVAEIRTEEAEVLLRRIVPGVIPPMEGLQRHFDLAAREVDQYRSVPRDGDERLALDDFLKEWAEHRGHWVTIEALSGSGQTSAALDLFQGAGRISFEHATEALRRLIDLTEAKANTAREVAAETIREAQRFVSDLILAIVVMFVTLATYLWFSFSRPLLDLAGRMKRLATDDTSFQIPFEHKKGEIGAMARSLAILRHNSIELLESRKRLGMQADVLTRSLEKERELAAEQRNFITTMSHEFRTPLTSIDGNAQRLIATKDRTTPTQIVDRAQRIRSAVFRLTSLVSSLTGAMEMSNTPMRPRMRRFDFSAMLGDLARYYRDIGFGNSLDEQIAELPKEVSGDPELLYYAFSNLVSNAFKYSPEGGIVTLAARTRNDFVEVVVEDRGLGIPAEEIDRVRERYYRASNVGSISGTGVGLHLVDRIVRRHGGVLEIDSEVGRGTRMTVSLPIESTDASHQEKALDQDPLRRGRQGDGEPSGRGPDGPRLHS